MMHSNLMAGALASFTFVLGLTGCGGGGSPTTDQGEVRFVSSTVDGVPQILDRTTGITWAGRLGASGLPQGAGPAFVADLLTLADGDAAVLQDTFSFVSGARIAASEQPIADVNLTWTVDFGQVGDPGTVSLAAVTETPDYVQWWVLARSSGPSVPTYFPNLGNGTVSGEGLMWKLCSEGSTYSSATQSCTSSAAAMTYASTDGYVQGASAFSGVTGWRLPTKQELQSLMRLENDVTGTGTLLPSAFDKDINGRSLLQYWTSSVNVANDARWQVDFSGGHDGSVSLSPNANDVAYLRLVRTIN